MPIKKWIYLVSGCVMVALGVAGIILPLLPTTPFLLLAGFFFARSSEKLNHWLLNHKHLGPYIHAFRSKTGLTRSQKIRIVCSMTITMGISLYFAPIVAVKCLLAVMWGFWCVVLFRMKTAQAT